MIDIHFETTAVEFGDRPNDLACGRSQELGANRHRKVGFFPKSRILTVVPILFFIRLIHLPATVFIFVWFLIQFLGGISSVGRASDVGGVAFWAHLGGFAAGLILARHFDKQKYYSQKSFNGYYKN